MLTGAIGVFLDSVTEREFDPALLGLLASQGFHDVHFIHGSFEFGKDVIAKRAHPDTGVMQQFAIQSKAGDIGVAGWREVRPQLEETEYNTRAHPNFDASLPRVSVLLTTGRLKGSAAVDAQEFGAALAGRLVSTLQVWDRETLAAWIASNPDVAALSIDDQAELQRTLAAIRFNTLDEPQLELFTRRWTHATPSGVAAIEAAVLVNALRENARLDLAAMCALHFSRGMQVGAATGVPNPQADAARRLFESICSALLDAASPLLADQYALARATSSVTSLVTYPAATVRITELLALAALVTDSEERRTEFEDAVVSLAQNHPGAARPISDQFAVSLIPIVCVLSQQGAASPYLRSVAKWLLDRSDPKLNGLGLGSIDEPPLKVVGRLLGGALEGTTVEPNRMSYLLTVLLDLCVAVGDYRLFADVRADAAALRLTPCTTRVLPAAEQFRRAGGSVRPVPRVEYGEHGMTYPSLPTGSGWPATDSLLLVASCRSRHFTDDIAALLERE